MGYGHRMVQGRCPDSRNSSDVDSALLTRLGPKSCNLNSATWPGSKRVSQLVSSCSLGKKNGMFSKEFTPTNATFRFGVKSLSILAAQGGLICTLHHIDMKDDAMPTYKAVTPIVAYAGFTKDGEFKLVPLDQLKILDGIEYNDESFLEHMDQPLASLLKKATGIRLSLNEGNDVLTAVTVFESAKELGEQELAQLKSYYYGQMCDGIGENFLSELKNREDVTFRLEVYELYDSDMQSQLQKVT